MANLNWSGPVHFQPEMFRSRQSNQTSMFGPRCVMDSGEPIRTGSVGFHQLLAMLGEC